MSARHIDLDDLRIRLRQRVREVALAVLGKENPGLSSRTELRWGRKGSLALATAGPKQGQWFDHEAGHGGDLLDLIQRVRGGDFTAALAFAIDIIGGVAIVPPPIATKAERKGDCEDDRTCYALRVWNESRPILGTIAAAYLTSTRSIDIAQIPDIDDVLRFHPRCRFRDERMSCLLTLMRDIVTDEPTGIIRTAISTCAENLGRKMLGRKRGAAVKLWPDAAVTTGLVVGEGVETVAAAATRVRYGATLLQPAWALCDAGNLAGFAPLLGIESLTILTDHDDGRVGENAAEVCARRWVAAGRDVELLVPRGTGHDFADVAAAEVSS
jgi:hypothetical protein